MRSQIFSLKNAFSYIEFSNVVCTSLDKEFTDFDYCYLKAINRSYKYISVKVKLYVLPITNVTVRYALLKKANGYKPFLYNKTINACSFLKNRKHPVHIFMHDLIKERSNMNHTCPFDHDLIIDKLDSQYFNDKLMLLPFPPGEYAIFTTWSAYNIPRANFNVYVRVP
ncbi:uncharacterized protein LOC119674472 [Teleopsis dalmanni]|uniref:uncharacterized protein LOC119674472 n=1 Tax=Teleopsis dalmanni TaxID=139649 RepID=UPI0018CC9583|nr:uncharacterized protein LOC119674472 [Teleopsis dalmanni]